MAHLIVAPSYWRLVIGRSGGRCTAGGIGLFDPPIRAYVRLKAYFGLVQGPVLIQSSGSGGPFREITTGTAGIDRLAGAEPRPPFIRVPFAIGFSRGSGNWFDGCWLAP
jgi:hypothetical protein